MKQSEISLTPPRVNRRLLQVTFKKSFGLLIRVAGASYAILIAISIFRALLPALQLTLTKSLVDSVAVRQGFSHTLWLSSLLVATFLGIYIFENISHYIANRISYRMALETNIDIVESAARLEVQHYENSDIYDIVQRADPKTGSQIFGMFESGRNAFQSLITMFSVVLVLSSWSPWIAFLLLIAPLPSAIATLRLAAIGFDIEYERAAEEREAGYFRTLLWSDSAIKEIKTYRLAGRFIKRYSELQKKFYKQDLWLARKNLTLAGTLGVLTVIANGIAITWGAYYAEAYGTVGELAGYIAASGTLSGTIMTLFLGLSGIYQSLLFASNWIRLKEIELVEIPEGKLILDSSQGVGIQFENIDFTYPGTTLQVLDDISFKIQPNSTTAIVGLNGAGKSSLIKLLLRFYTPDRGRILLNGSPIESYSRDSLYDTTSVLFQDYVQYQRTLRENVGFGDLKQLDSEEAIKRCVYDVGLEGLLEEGVELETMLGRRFKNGRQLSVGQWQRVAAARALLSRPGLLILDEPTASVDAMSERLFFTALSNEKKKRTMLLIAHRFSTILHADYIVVLDEGRVIGMGSHKELLVRCKRYAELYDAQMDGLLPEE